MHLDIFLHIPKTGGITLYQILEHNYPPEHTWRTYPHDWDDLQRQVREMPPERRRSLRLIEGHVPYGVHTLFERPARCFTMLRNPVSRTLSYYYYVRSHPDNPHYEAARTMSLEEYLESGLLLDNGQTRWLANIQRQIPFGKTTPEMLEQAQENLQNLAVVGLVEHYDESLLLMKAVLGWRWLFYRRRNVTANRPPQAAIPPETLRLIEDIHALDCALYRRAQELFQRQLQRLHRLGLEKALFTRLNQLYMLANRLRHPLQTS